MFVLTQLPTFPQLLNSSPGKAIWACAPKVLSVRTSAGLVLDLTGSGPGGCLAAWGLEGEAQYYPVTLGGLSGLALIIFFIIMRKYAYRRRGYRGHKPSYTVNRKFCRNLTWNKLANDAIFIPRRFSWFIILVLSLAISLGLFFTIKHLEVQLQDLLTYYGLNQTRT